MVRATFVLLRVPVIKFRKGAIGSSHSGHAAPGSAAGAGSAQPSVAAAHPAASMSTGTISDINLPLRYRRRPMSQEEIDHINGGGIV